MHRWMLELCSGTVLVLVVAAPSDVPASCVGTTSDVFIYCPINYDENAIRYNDDYANLIISPLEPDGVEVFKCWGNYGLSASTALGDSVVAGLTSCRTVWILAHGVVDEGRPVMFHTQATYAEAYAFWESLSLAAQNYLKVEEVIIAGV
jgi:hypothetical protein